MSRIADSKIFLCYFLLVFGIVLVIPSFRLAYFNTHTMMFDVGAYLDIAKNDYRFLFQYAWQPLFPFLLRFILPLFPQSIDSGLVASLISVCLFCPGALMFRQVLGQIFSQKVANLTFILFLCQPLGVFFFIGYTESLSLFLGSSLLFFWLKCVYLESRKQFFYLFLSAFLVSLCRPQWMQILFALLISLLINGILILASKDNRGKNDEGHTLFSGLPKSFVTQLKISLVCIIGLILGYLSFCLFCYGKTGDFFASVHAQKHWGKVFKPHWSLIYSPKAVSDSDNVLYLGLFSFYFPALCLLVLGWKSIRNKSVKFYEANLFSNLSETEFLPNFFLIFGLAFCAAQSGIQFFSSGTFLSIERYVLTSPFSWVGFAGIVALAVEKDNKENRKDLAIKIVALILFCLQIYWWKRFSRGAWIG